MSSRHVSAATGKGDDQRNHKQYDDTAATWKTRTYRGQGGKEFTQYSGSFELPLGTGEKAQKVSLGTYRFDKNDPQRAPLKNFLFYYRDYAWDGQITLNGAKYHTMISDDRATGDLRASAADAAGAAAQAAPIRMLIDVKYTPVLVERSPAPSASFSEITSPLSRC